ncbi:MAG: hypothetical protein AAGN82_21620 [Myxococcota bacterium]
MEVRPRWYRLALLLAVLTGAPTVRAQDPADVPPATNQSAAITTGLEQRRPFWRGSGRTRPFFAATLDGGALYLRPTAHFGYGRPHFEWVGAELGTGLSLGGLTAYAGLRGVFPYLDLSVGARYEAPRNQAFLPRQPSFLREELELTTLPQSRYVVGQVEGASAIPFPGGNLLLVASGYYLSNVPDDFLLWEQSLRVVSDAPWMWRGRLGYLYHVGWLGTLRVGATAEFIHLVGRGEVVVRTGPALSVSLTHHLEAHAAALLVVSSPDALGLRGADLGRLGLSYRWALGDRWAEFP